MFKETIYICTYEDIGIMDVALGRIATIEQFKRDERYNSTKQYVVMTDCGNIKGKMYYDVYELTGRSH